MTRKIVFQTKALQIRLSMSILLLVAPSDSSFYKYSVEVLDRYGANE